MAVIPNFPDNLSDLHHNWHSPGSHPGFPTRVHPFGTAGAGLEFLQFHRDFVTQFHAWYDVQPFGTAPFNVAPFQTAANAAAAVAGWTAIPAALKNGAVTGWGSVQASQETRITTNNPPFSSEDDLGTYIEGGIHGWIHGAAAAAFGEPVVGTFHSPRSTYFYGIHGLVDYWWTQWQTRKSVIKDIVDTKVRIKEKDFVKEHKEFVKDHKELIKEKDFTKEHKEVEKPFKDKDKDIFEGGGLPGGGGDPGPLLQNLVQRMSTIESQMAAGRAFIRAEERPDVSPQSGAKRK